MCECISQPRWIPVKRPVVNLASLSFWPPRSFLVVDIFLTCRMKNMWCLLSGWSLASTLRLSCYWYFGVSIHREWTPAAYPGGAHLSPASKVLSILHSWPVEISINFSNLWSFQWYHCFQNAQKEPTLLTPWSQTFSFQKWETVNLYHLKLTHFPYFVKAALENQYRELCMCLSFQYLLSGIKHNSIQFLRLLWNAHVTNKAKWLAHVRCSTSRSSSHIRTPTISDWNQWSFTSMAPSSFFFSTIFCNSNPKCKEVWCHL